MGALNPTKNYLEKKEMNKKIKLNGISDQLDEMFDLLGRKKCPFCGKKVSINDFENELEKKEFALSGLCKKCQDSFFNGDDDED